MFEQMIVPAAADDPADQAGDGPQLVLTIEQAARRLGIGRTLMYALVQSGEVESVRIGRLHRVPVDALSEYVAELRARNTHRVA